jgi:hypothetical protein
MNIIDDSDGPVFYFVHNCRKGLNLSLLRLVFTFALAPSKLCVRGLFTLFGFGIEVFRPTITPK